MRERVFLWSSKYFSTGSGTAMPMRQCGLLWRLWWQVGFPRTLNDKVPPPYALRASGGTPAPLRDQGPASGRLPSLSAGVTRWMHRRKPHGPRAARLQLDERGADDGGDAGVGQDAARTKGARDREDAQVAARAPACRSVMQRRRPGSRRGSPQGGRGSRWRATRG